MLYFIGADFSFENFNLLEYYNPTVHNIKDFDIISEILESIHNIQSSNLSFDFFDLFLSDYDHHILSQVKIDDSNTLFINSNSKDFHNNIFEFFDSVLDDHVQESVIKNLTDLTLKITDNIIDASGYDSATVSMIAYNDGDKNYFPCWHVDKTHQEEITYLSNQNIQSNSQNIFIVTLIGASTLYHPMNENIRKEFNLIANETSHSYGYDRNLHYVPNQGIDKLFKIENSYQARLGQGSVHLAGYDIGTIHATPPGKERLLMIITPSDKQTIDQLHL